MKRKKLISILKKYHEFEKLHGTEKSAGEVLERAKKIAAEYENEKEEESDD